MNKNFCTENMLQKVLTSAVFLGGFCHIKDTAAQGYRYASINAFLWPISKATFAHIAMLNFCLSGD
jgi:hypothetical protein